MTKPDTSNNTYINREISWLQFNARVLQEASDETVPLIERLRFLGIFSNNLDEFFKVRYATVKRIVDAGKEGKNQLGGIKAKELLDIITQIVIKQQSKSLETLDNIKEKLEDEDIYIIDETQIDNNQHLVSVYPNLIKAKSLCHHWIKHLCYSSESPVMPTSKIKL